MHTAAFEPIYSLSFRSCSVSFPRTNFEKKKNLQVNMYESRLSTGIALAFVIGGLTSVIILAVVSHNEMTDRDARNTTWAPSVAPTTAAPKATISCTFGSAFTAWSTGAGCPAAGSALKCTSSNDCIAQSGCLPGAVRTADVRCIQGQCSTVVASLPQLQTNAGACDVGQTCTFCNAGSCNGVASCQAKCPTAPGYECHTSGHTA
jgi:hypothetical protein